MWSFTLCIWLWTGKGWGPPQLSTSQARHDHCLGQCAQLPGGASTADFMLEACNRAGTVVRSQWPIHLSVSFQDLRMEGWMQDRTSCSGLFDLIWLLFGIHPLGSIKVCFMHVSLHTLCCSLQYLVLLKSYVRFMTSIRLLMNIYRYFSNWSNLSHSLLFFFFSTLTSNVLPMVCFLLPGHLKTHWHLTWWVPCISYKTRQNSPLGSTYPQHSQLHYMLSESNQQNHSKLSPPFPECGLFEMETLRASVDPQKQICFSKGLEWGLSTVMMEELLFQSRGAVKG